jgi:hypothetical protein
MDVFSGSVIPTSVRNVTIYTTTDNNFVDCDITFNVEYLWAYSFNIRLHISNEHLIPAVAAHQNHMQLHASALIVLSKLARFGSETYI